VVGEVLVVIQAGVSWWLLQNELCSRSFALICSLNL